MKKKNVDGGFTLVELLVAVAIIGVLSSFIFVGVSKVRIAAKMAREMAAGRSLITAYLTDASDNHGLLMAGIDPDATATDKAGNSYPGYVAKRYPARLAPILNWNFSGSVCVNESEAWADQFYTATVSPAFGMNVTFVGGSFREPEPDPVRDAEKYGAFCIQRLLQADQPSKQMVFISARQSGGGKNAETPGNFYVRSPYLKGRRWADKYDEDSSSLEWGNVHPRYHGKAVAVFLDGGVRTLNAKQVQDMRFWAKGAREADDSEWTLRRE